MSDSETRVERMLRAIRQIIQRTTVHSRKSIRVHNLTVPQCLCLKLLAESRPTSWTVAALSQQIQLSTAATSRVVDKLVKEGLVSRDIDEHDRRRVCLALTSAGKKRLKSLPPPLQEEFVNRYQKLKAADQKQLLDCLETLVGLMGATELDETQIPETDRSL